MSLYLIGFAFHEPEPFADWSRGLIEDYESSTGLFVEADSPAEAIAWGEEVAQALLRQVNQDDSLVWNEFAYPCWVEESPTTSCWSRCLDFFLRVRVGEMPNLEQMGTAAYCRWQEAKAGRTHLWPLQSIDVPSTRG